MDNSQEQAQPETQPSELAASPPPGTTPLGDRVRDVRDHLERASAALAALNQLLPASTQPLDEAHDGADERSEP